MKGFLLDTCAYIEVFRGNINTLKKFSTVPKSDRYVSEITVAELLLGIEKANNKYLEEQKVNDFLQDVTILPISSVLHRFAKEKARLLKQGTPIEDFDILIGATATEHSLMLITDNTKHLSRIEGLELENWK